MQASAQVPGGGVRCTAAQLGGGVDFASTSFRVRFNDLQARPAPCAHACMQAPDRSLMD